MRLKSWLVRVGLIVAVTMIPMLAAAGSASAVTLNGDWAPLTRCPVDDPSMLAADGVTINAGCIADDSPSGSAKIGSTTVTTGDTNLQLGLLENNSAPISTFSGVSPAGGALVAAPANVPGGLLGLMCPSSIPVISQICATLVVGSPLNTVTAVVKPAGAPSELNPFNALGPGRPIVTLPVKIQLRNPTLGSNCYIGSDTNPVVLHPENLVAPSGYAEAFDANGTPDRFPNAVLYDQVLNGTEGDTTFAVPAATGCGGLLSAVITPVVNAKVGLPSPSGKNSLVLNNARADLVTFGDPSAYAPNEGQQLAADWHSAVLP
jgi:hypothetical protein